MYIELMLDPLVAGPVIVELSIFLSYILVCVALFKSRFSRRVIVLAVGGAGLIIEGANIAFMLTSGDLNFMLTLLPLTAYLPFSVLLYFLSDSGVFETVAVCSVGMLDVLILKSLQKILTDIVQGESLKGAAPVLIMYVVIVLAAAAGWGCRVQIYQKAVPFVRS